MESFSHFLGGYSNALGIVAASVDIFKAHQLIDYERIEPEIAVEEDLFDSAENVLAILLVDYLIASHFFKDDMFKVCDFSPSTHNGLDPKQLKTLPSLAKVLVLHHSLEVNSLREDFHLHHFVEHFCQLGLGV